MTKSRRKAFTISVVLAIVLAVLVMPSRATGPQTDQPSSATQTKTKGKKAKKAKKAKEAKTTDETQAGKTKASKKSRKAKASGASPTNSESTAAASGEKTPKSSAEAPTRSSRASATSSDTGSTTQTPPSPGMVWVNTDSGVYHKSGRWYGKTKHGKFMNEADAVKAGYKPAKRE